MKGQADSLIVIVIFVPTVDSLRIIFPTKIYFKKFKQMDQGCIANLILKTTFVGC